MKQPPAGGGAKHRQQAMKRKRVLTGSGWLFPRQAPATNPSKEPNHDYCSKPDPNTPERILARRRVSRIRSARASLT